MSGAVIAVENLSKRYRLGVIGATTLRDSAERLWQWMCRGSIQEPGFAGRRTDGVGLALSAKVSSDREDEIWALKDVSFEVGRGEVLGIIGRNGAGKSTLLKILSNITEPTRGRAIIRGRVASLLEVGTGFHPELTGRENIFLNGAILGMDRAEVRMKFDEIVEFSGMGRFIDTPVKRYSSGMYVRLAFAVAAHLEHDVLMVDEVLAVGDAEFRSKCIGTMKGIANSGRTVLVVSHNLDSVLSLCGRALLLREGTLVADGEPHDVVGQYLSHGTTKTGRVRGSADVRPGQKVKIRQVEIQDDAGVCAADIDKSRGLRLSVDFDVLVPGRSYVVSVQLFSIEHGCVFTSSSWDADVESGASQTWTTGFYRAGVRLPCEILRGGDYWARVAIAVPGVEFLDILEQGLPFRLIDTCSPLAKHREGRDGVILPVLDWDVSGVP